MDFEKLYEVYYMQVYSYVMTILRNSQLAEEITQDVFFKALKITPMKESPANLHGCVPLQKMHALITLERIQKRGKLSWKNPLRTLFVLNVQLKMRVRPFGFIKSCIK